MTFAAIGGPLIGGLAAGAAGSLLGGGSKAGNSNVYSPEGLNMADTGWQNMFGQQQQFANQTAQQTAPLYQQSLNQQTGINYQPYLQAGQQAGQQYGTAANMAGQQMGLAGQQQQNMYNAGNQVMNTAFDPQQALYNRTQQQLGDQINVGQAQRGLGNSAVGGAEYNQGMSNFNIDWQNAQLARQAQGIQAGAQANAAGGQQGQFLMANAAAQPGYTMQAGQTPIQAQQYVAGQPAAAAQQYQTGMSNQNAMLGNVAGQAIPYMYQGAGTQQQQQGFNAQQNAATANMFGQAATAGINSYNQPGSWLNNLFGGSSGGQNAAPVGASQADIWAAGGAGGV